MVTGWLNDISMLGRLAWDIRPFLKNPLTTQEARQILQQRLETRGQRFLDMARSAIYGNPRSPYLQLLRATGCELGDITALVVKEGLEQALSRLSDAGVYVTFDEFKGRSEAVRGNRRFAFAEEDFDNPNLSPHYEAQSGGSRSPGTAVKVALPFITDLAAASLLALEAHGLSRWDHAIWLIAAVTPTLLYAKLGRTPLAWFYPVNPLPMKVKAGALYLASLGRVFGTPFPIPRFLDLKEPAAMAVWLARRLEEGRSICVTTYASLAVQIAAAAKEQGILLRGVCFITLGEPFTEAKQKIVESVEARPLVRYAFTEAGIIGFQCGEPRLSDDMHFFSDRYGLIQRTRAVGDSGLSVDAFLFTSLLAAAPKILLNVESGDYGDLGQWTCNCRMGTAGLTTHVGRVRSFEKLSGEGMTFVQTDLLRVLEEVLPARFGGTGSDYQLLEEEAAEGGLRLRLVVSPRLGDVDEARVRDTFLKELGGVEGFGRLSARVWRRAATLEVRRQWPAVTKAGKILPFHLLKRQRPSAQPRPVTRVPPAKP